jgi:hypothetical protein
LRAPCSPPPPPTGRRSERVRALSCLLTGFAIPIAIEWFARIHYFGSVGTTGYQYWQPEVYSSWRTCYNPAFLWESPWRGSAYGNLHFYLRALSGWRAALWSPVTAAFIAVGLAVAWKRRREPAAYWFSLLPLASAAFYLPYAYQDQRMNVPVVPLFAIAGGLGLEAVLLALRTAPVRNGLVVAAFLGALFGIGVGDRGQRGAVETSVAGELEDALEVAAAARPLALDASLARAAAAAAPDGVVIADLARLQLGFYLPHDVEVINLSIATDDPAGEGPDEEVRLILKNGLKPIDGGPPPRVLIRDGRVDRSVVDELRRADAAGRPVELWLTRLSSRPVLSRELADVFEESSSRRLSDPAEPLERYRMVLKRE